MSQGHQMTTTMHTVGCSGRGFCATERVETGLPPQPTSAFRDSAFTAENIPVTPEMEAEGRKAQNQHDVNAFGCGLTAWLQVPYDTAGILEKFLICQTLSFSQMEMQT